MPQYTNFTGGMTSHSLLVGEWQVSYASKVQLRIPWKIMLGQKSELVTATGTDLCLSMYNWGGNALYMWSKWGKVYDTSATVRATLTGASSVPLAIYNIVWVWSHIYLAAAYNSNDVNNFVIARISMAESANADRGAQSSRDATHEKAIFMKKTLFQWSDCYFLDNALVRLLENDAPGTISFADGLWSRIASFWKSWQDIKAVTNAWKMIYMAPLLDNIIFSYDLSSLMMDWFMLEWSEFIIWGGTPSSSVLYAPNGYWKQVVGRAYVDIDAENVEKFFFGRTNGVLTETYPTNTFWDNIFDSANNITYAINKNKILSRGSDYNLPTSFSYLTDTNSAWDVLTEIWFVKVISTSTNTYLYYSWENEAGNCWVDRVDITNNVPTSYHSSGVVYSWKLQLSPDPLQLDRLRIRAYTTAWQTIKVYASIDWDDYYLVETLNGTDPKEYQIVWRSPLAREVQFKFLFETNDWTKTPELLSYWFNAEWYDT